MASTDSLAESDATISISDFSSDEQKDEEESCGDDESLVQPYRFEPFCESEEDVAESSSDADDDSQHEDSARLQNTAWWHGKYIYGVTMMTTNVEEVQTQ
ncbi:hypothetical protein OJAV_G00049390 [Oryzias javanicus]|uniref:Uncharacterized protein n=1 Tax=Oryzias javanicus TaxID=123683 RepID=A0A437DEU1_ORYJA|nr:hypothetical protein OJAV_G00049390 [Oryzias javanicus]